MENAARTLGGIVMLRVKACCVVGPLTERMWREHRAENIAKLIAWDRRARRFGRFDFMRDQIKDAVDDCGWPKLAWLKRRVRAEQARIEASLASFYDG